MPKTEVSWNREQNTIETAGPDIPVQPKDWESAVEPEQEASPRTKPKQNGERFRLLRNIGALAVCPMEGGQSEIRLIRDAAILWKGDTILYAGEESGLREWFHIHGPSDSQKGTSDSNEGITNRSEGSGNEISGITNGSRGSSTGTAAASDSGTMSDFHYGPAEEQTEVFDACGRLVVPGLIDCHTHLAFGGWRPDEFEMRSLGKTYEEIAAAGGGILSTMKATREITEDALLDKSADLLHRIMSLGVTTIECKSGYGLDPQQELKQLWVYRRLQEQSPVRILSTFLGAHAIPPEYSDDREGYISLVINEMMPRVLEHDLAVFCDVFADVPAFTVKEAEKILLAAKAVGLIPKIHADQLTECGGAELAARVEAISADHLECISNAGIRAMKEAGTVAVSLPLATWYLRKKPIPTRSMIHAGVPVAVSTDFNPGSAPSYHLPFAMHLACTLQYMSPAEVLKGATIHAAAALGLDGIAGSIESGKKADFVEIDAGGVPHASTHADISIASGYSDISNPVDQWMYHFQADCAVRVWAGGECVVSKNGL